MGYIGVDDVTYALPDGRLLLNEVSFRVGDGVTAALVGPNGAGKTTLMRLVAGALQPSGGRITRSGGLGVMAQFIGSSQEDQTVQELLLSAAPERIRCATAELQRAERAMSECDDEEAQLAYARAITDYADAGGIGISINLISHGDVQGAPLAEMAFADFDSWPANSERLSKQSPTLAEM